MTDGPAASLGTSVVCADPTEGRAMAKARPELDRFTVWRAKLGDPRAFATLVGSYEPRVRAFVSRMCGGDHALVDDMMQETFLRVFRSLRRFSFDGDAKLSTWIMTIATRTVIDDRRRTKRRARLAWYLEAVVDVGTGPDEHAEAAATRQRIDRALLDLSEPIQATFTLRVFCELSEAETAAVMGIDVGTVKSRVSRCREYLRCCLQAAPLKERP
jgi:RNA polymerase sigma-70 factor (ECF subfamily)